MTSSPRLALHGGNPWALLEPSAADPSGILDFSVDVNPMGPPPSLERLLAEAAPRAAWYPEPTYREFREAAGRAEGVDPESVLPGNGTADLIHLLSRWKAGGRTGVFVPTFTEYERAAAADAGSVTPWVAAEADGFAPRIQEETDAELVFLCNPNNPTGVLLEKERLLGFVEQVERRGGTVVVDEAYMEFVEDGRRYSLAPMAERSRGLVVLRSLTKCFAIPGLRVGYGVGPAAIVRRLREIQPPWALNGPAAFVAARLLAQESLSPSVRRLLGEWRSALTGELERLPWLKVFPSSANFLLCRLLDPGLSARALAERLAERGILIRVCDDFTGLEPGRFIRVAVRRPEENGRLLDGLREAARAG